MNETWHEYNKRYLEIKIKEVQKKLQSYLENETTDTNKGQDHEYNGISSSTSLRKNNAQMEDTVVFETNENNKEKSNSDFKNLPRTGLSESITDQGFLPALEILSRAFNLSEFEKNMVLLCAAVELDSETSRLCSKIQVNRGDFAKFATFALGFAIFPDGHWSALIPTAPLRRFQILNVSNLHSGNHHVSLSLTINEQVLHYLVGLAYSESDFSVAIQNPSKLIDPGIKRIVREKTLPYYSDNIAKVLRAFNTKTNKGTTESDEDNPEQKALPVIILSGGDEIDGIIISQEVCNKLCLQLRYLNAANIPTNSEDLRQFIQTWTRDSILLRMGLFITQDNIAENQDQTIQTVKLFVENIPAPIFLNSSQIMQLTRSYNILHLKRPSRTDQFHLWRIFLGPLFKIYDAVDDEKKNQIIKKLVNQFDFRSSEIYHVCKTVYDQRILSKIEKRKKDNINSLIEFIWYESLAVSRPNVGNLGIMVPFSSTSSSSVLPSDLPYTSTTNVSFEDIVLPPHEKELLKTILIHSQQRHKVYGEWGFEEKNRGRGLGISVLFAGASGTGKTMAAEILSSELKLSLLRINLSQVASKWVGETAKNIGKIFESAEKGGVVLFADEAESLFATRTEIKQSLDRYANIETGYLLQRMESYNGLVILSTNMPNVLDNAFVRRIRFKVTFPFPDEESRFKIWKKTFPNRTPLGSLDFSSLAKLKLSGGNINNICLNAAFFAAHDNKPVNMTHIKKGLQIEYSKMGQSMTNNDFFT